MCHARTGLYVPTNTANKANQPSICPLGCILMVIVYGILMKPIQVKSIDENGTTQKQITTSHTDHRNSSIKTVSNDERAQSKTILDLRILKNRTMALLCLSNLFGMTGYYIPYFYIANFAVNTIKKGFVYPN